MKVIKIDKEKWASGIETLKGSYKLSGPVKDNDFHYFKELGKTQLPDLDYNNSRLSPKSSVFPQSEIMMTYSTDDKKDDHHVMKEADKDYSPRAFIGIRPCDARSMSLVKLNFDTKDYQDPYWVKAYEASTFVGLACDKPGETCFCTTTGCGPYGEEGLDVLLSKMDDGGYMAKSLTKKGDTLLKSAGWDTEGDASIYEPRKEAAEKKIESEIRTGNLDTLDTLDLYNAPFWEDVSFACINCGTCTFACPTCWCFDIQDETRGHDGVRIKNWDSCMFPLFTVHTTGHNPRGTKLQRVRQRFMHKLKYFVDKYSEGTMCVGCGRCVNQCPVNIDIRNICNKMNDYKKE